MLTFMHTYTSESWAGVLQNGLWRDGDGLKMMHKPFMPAGTDFNSAARVGSPLEKTLRELRCPFYVDRLQGGMGLDRLYPFDRGLLAYYQRLLGDGFWGFQMHEWSSNYRSDAERILAMYRTEGDPTPSGARKKELWRDVKAGRIKLFLEAMTAEEWENKPLPTDRAAFLADIESLYAARSRLTDGLLIPADSYHMAPRIELDNGAKLLLPEIGWQIPNLRIQIAYTRGMARARGVRWGVYYECWCHNTAVNALTIPFSLRDGQDEWFEDQLTKGNGAAFSAEEREQGGTSRNLQERAWRFAYLSGATVMGEEYGVSTTFRDYRDFDLSPYGRVKKAFLRFCERFDNIGEPFTPFAVVLPKELPVLNVDLPENYLGYPAADGSGGVSGERWREVCRTLQRIFGERSKAGNNGHVLTSGGLPDVFDIIHEDEENALRRYDYLIDLTGKTGFAEKYPVVTAEEADRLLSDLLPFRLPGRLQTLYRRTSNGWLVFAANNDGVLCDRFRGDVFLPEADVTAAVEHRGGKGSVCVLDGTGRLFTDGGRDYLTLRAGEWVLLHAPDETV